MYTLISQWPQTFLLWAFLQTIYLDFTIDLAFKR